MHIVHDLLLGLEWEYENATAEISQGTEGESIT